MVAGKRRKTWLLVLVLVPSLLGGVLRAEEKEQKTPPARGESTATKPAPPVGYNDTPFLPDGKWRVHDGSRPRPRVISPPTASLPERPGAPPSDAVVLFDGSNLAHWTAEAKRGGEPADPGWKVENGYMEVVPGTSSIVSKERFGDCQLHVEWATPAEVKGDSQGRGNSGLLIMGRYEIQVLDSSHNVTYADGQAGAIYGQYPPLVNASRPPGEWQVYDIIFQAPRFEGEKLQQPAYVTVLHNGVVVHNHQQLLGPMRHKEVARYQPHDPEGPLMLQAHGNPVRYRNIWVRRLGGYDEPVASTRWEEQILALEAADKENPPPQGGIVFVGSSSIRRWKLDDSFPELPVINRGFGGSEIADSLYFADRIVLPHRPKVVVLYAGDNDIANQKTARQVATDYREFAATVHAALPDTRIVFISIKPSIRRWQLIEDIRQANQLIRQFSEQDERRFFFDVEGPMLNEKGEPRAELFVADGLHLNDDGYELWSSRLRPLLAKLAGGNN